MSEGKEKIEQGLDGYVEEIERECCILQKQNQQLTDTLTQRMKFDTEQLLPSLLDRIEKLSKPPEIINKYFDGE